MEGHTGRCLEAEATGGNRRNKAGNQSRGQHPKRGKLLLRDGVELSSVSEHGHGFAGHKRSLGRGT